MGGPSARCYAPAAERNREPIAAVLDRILPTKGLILEIASGTGQHVEFFARRYPHLQWQPTDLEPAALASIAAWSAGIAGVRPPLVLDVTQAEWPVHAADAVICCNMIHIAPWEACLGLLAGAARILTEKGALILYGPYRIADQAFAPSNQAFDEDLRARDPRWGVRRLEDVVEVAQRVGLTHAETIAMPANNHIVVFRRGA